MSKVVTREYLDGFVEKLQARFGDRLTAKEWKEVHASARGYAGGKISRPAILKPYASVDALPSEVKDALPKAAQKLFLRVVNRVMSEDPEDEQGAFKQAWGALKAAGWEKDGERWRKKSDLNKSNGLHHLYVPPVIPRGARVVFVDMSPSQMEAVRGQQMVGPVGTTFKKQYLDPLGLKRSEVGFVCAVPIYLSDNDGNERPPTNQEITAWSSELNDQLGSVEASVVAVSRRARDILDGVSAYLPHPEAIRKFGQRDGELTRKIELLRKNLTKRKKCASICQVKKEFLAVEKSKEFDTRSVKQNDTVSKSSADLLSEIKKKHENCELYKRDEDLRIAYYAVLKPGIKDKQGHVVAKQEIEKACRDWMLKSQVIGDNHEGPSDARVVECWIGRKELGYEESKDYPDGTWFIGIYEPCPKRWAKEKEMGGGAVSIGGLGKLTAR